MIKYLQVVNYALIENLDVNFEEGFTVITGETGAGKSIILGALGLILGNRADTSVLLDKTKKCIVEGHFDVDNQGLEVLFEKYLLDFCELTSFRREISPQGRSRAFVNDTPVSLEVLKEIAEKLINIHSQHKNLLIGNNNFQFDVVDSFCLNLEQVESYRQSFKEFIALKSHLEVFELEAKKLRADLDYFRFQHNELEAARLNSEEFKEIEKNLEILQNSEEIRLALEKSAHILSTTDNSILVNLKESLGLLKQISDYSDEYKNLFLRLESLFIETKDLSFEIERCADKVSNDPTFMMELQARVDLVNKLLLKHGVTEVSELERIKNEFWEKIQGIDLADERINSLKSEIVIKEQQLTKLANQISQKRLGSIETIEKSVTGLLHKLGMPGAKFVVKIEKLNKLTINGYDKLDFLFSANPGSELREISKVASGGEISRLMLGIKSMISQKNFLPTIIFDEIDTGVSGETATRVADILGSISEKMQVIAITHLPQIASRGQQHLVVQKTIENNKTTTTIIELNDDHRVNEIAKMLGGKSPSEAMITTARELINH